MPGFDEGYSSGINNAATIANVVNAQQGLELQKQGLDTSRELGLRAAALAEKQHGLDTEKFSEDKRAKSVEEARLSAAAAAQARVFDQQFKNEKLTTGLKEIELDEAKRTHKSFNKDADYSDYNKREKERIGYASLAAQQLDEAWNRNGGDVNKLLANPEDWARASQNLSRFFSHPAMTDVVRQEAAANGKQLPINEGGIRYTIEADPENPGFVHTFAHTEKGNTYDLGQHELQELITEVKGFAGQTTQSENISRATGVSDSTARATLDAQAALNAGAGTRNDAAGVAALNQNANASQPVKQQAIVGAAINQFLSTDPSYRREHNFLESGKGIEHNLTRFTTVVADNPQMMKALYEKGLISTSDKSYLSESDWNNITYGVIELLRPLRAGMDNANPLADGLQDNELEIIKRAAKAGVIDQSQRPMVENVGQAADLAKNLGRSSLLNWFGYDGSTSRDGAVDAAKTSREAIKKQEEERKKNLRDYSR